MSLDVFWFVEDADPVAGHVKEELLHRLAAWLILLVIRSSESLISFAGVEHGQLLDAHEQLEDGSKGTIFLSAHDLAGGMLVTADISSCFCVISGSYALDALLCLLGSMVLGQEVEVSSDLVSGVSGCLRCLAASSVHCDLLADSRP